ncbi:MAG: hypothetical protein QOH95_2331, partial [Gaiellaceae bacterium]|nr:hypothetical protein [Gaiellaceae bacterium]
AASNRHGTLVLLLGEMKRVDGDDRSSPTPFSPGVCVPTAVYAAGAGGLSASFRRRRSRRLHPRSDCRHEDCLRRRRLAVAVLRPWVPVFIHGDLQLDHVFVDGAEVTGIIDCPRRPRASRSSASRKASDAGATRGSPSTTSATNNFIRRGEPSWIWLNQAKVGASAIAPALSHPGGRRFEPAWLHPEALHCGTFLLTGWPRQRPDLGGFCRARFRCTPTFEVVV